MKKSFLGADHPIFTLMIQKFEPEEMLKEIELAKKEGAEAFCLQIDHMEPKDRTAKNFKRIFKAMGDCPAYVTNYRRGNKAGDAQTCEQRADELLLAMKCGATLFDVYGDMFDEIKSDELATDEKAIEKQMELIRKVHEMGKEVLMSCHTLQYTSEDRVIEMMKEQKRRGADIAKLVGKVDTQAELDEAFTASTRVKRELGLPSLYLVGGEMCQPHRRLAPFLGSALYLVTMNEQASPQQPHLCVARTIAEQLR